MTATSDRKWMVGGFSIALAVMAAVSVASYQNTAALTSNTEHVQHTYTIVNRLTELYAEMAIAESGRRGYVFLNDERELTRYQEAVARLQAQLQWIQTQVDATDIQQQRLQRLTILVNQRLSLLKQSIALYQLDPTDTEQQRSLTEASIALRSEIQTTLTELKTGEEQSLQQSIARSRADIRYKAILELVGTLLSVAIIAAVYGILYLQQQQRQTVESLEWRLTREQELSDLKLRFFSMVSHEFRTPLSVILASSQLLQEILQEVVEPTNLKNLYRIQASARLMNQLLIDSLTLSRAEAGKLEYKPELLEIESFCLNLVEDIQFGLTSPHTIKFVSEGQCSRLYLDEKLTYSILSNLLMNAVKYSPDGGDICLRLTCQPDHTLFQVTDPGIGILPSDQDKIFDPFYRGQNTGSIAGTGLGLAVVKQCLTLQGGSITVTSQPEAGTTFTINIPHGLKPQSV